MRRLYFTGAQRRMIFGKTTSAMPSRFVREIRDDHLEIHEPRSFFGGYDSGRSFGGGLYGADESKSVPWSAGSESSFRSSGGFGSAGGSGGAGDTSKFAMTDVSSSSQTENFKKGDTIDHKAFGRGVIIGSSPAGGDALLEITFDSVGTKRMLLNSAVRYMSKATE
jgi:DNA helicase-2/ATP-dependent DNA helicase PcrA